MDNLTEQFSLRDRMRKRMWAQKTPSQRLHDMARRQQLALELLRQSPEGYARFLRRNFRARALNGPTDTTPNAS